jgi:hypothetical protein
VALLAAVAASLGVFARGDGTYSTVASVRGEVYQLATTGVYANNALQVVAEGVGWDVFTLVIAVPAMLVAALLAWRSSFRGTVLAAGLLGYFVYMYLEYAVTWAFGPLFPVFVAILALSVMGLVGTAALLAAEPLGSRFDGRFPRRAWAFLSVGMSTMLVVMWAGRISQGLAGPPELHGETTMTVQALDLGLMVPTSLLIAAATWLGSPVGRVAAAAFAVTFVAMSAAIASMMVSASITTGTLQLPPIVIFGTATLAGLVVLARMNASARVPDARPGSAPSPRELATTG